MSDIPMYHLSLKMKRAGLGTFFLEKGGNKTRFRSTSNILEKYVILVKDNTFTVCLSQSPSGVLEFTASIPIIQGKTSNNMG